MRGVRPAACQWRAFSWHAFAAHTRAGLSCFVLDAPHRGAAVRCGWRTQASFLEDAVSLLHRCKSERSGMVCRRLGGSTAPGKPRPCCAVAGHARALVLLVLLSTVKPLLPGPDFAVCTPHQVTAHRCVGPVLQTQLRTSLTRMQTPMRAWTMDGWIGAVCLR